jgi:hypothetical protein
VRFPPEIEGTRWPLQGRQSPIGHGCQIPPRQSLLEQSRSIALPATVLAWAALLGCGRQVELQACNTAKLSCQEDVYYAVVRLRGDGWDPFEGVPPIRTISIDEYRKELMPDDPPPADPGAEPPKPKVDPWDVALHWLHLVGQATTAPQAAGESRESIVAAYYAWEDQRVTVIDRGGERDDYNDTLLLVHELVHAFQDDEVSIVAGDGTTDAGFANAGLVEGEARLYEDLARAELDGVSARNVDWHSRYQQSLHAWRSSAPQQSSLFYYVQPWYAYDLGVDLLMDGWQRGGNARVRHLIATFPRKGLPLIAHHERVELDSAARLACEVEPPGDGFELAGHDRFGAIQTYAFLVAAGIDEPDAWRTSLDWRDDRIWLYFDEHSEQVALSWRIRLTDTAAAERVVAAASQLPMLRAERDGHDALIVGSDAGLARWKGAGDCEL